MTSRENYISFLAINQKIIWKVYQALSTFTEGFFGGSDGKESACCAGDPGSIPGLRRSPGEGNGSTIHAWRIPWTEEPGRLQSMGSQRAGHG